MSFQTLLAVLIFSTVMAFTPGPNNAMLASSGARFGLARTLPHAAGVTLGFPVMLFLVGWDWRPSCWTRRCCNWR